MKTVHLSMLVAASFAGAAHAEPSVDGEAIYPKTAIGYDALMSRDNDKAIRDMLAGNVSRHDPAF